MQGKTKGLVAFALVTIMLTGSLPANADHEPPVVIGTFERLGMEDDLTEDRVSNTTRGIQVDAPGLANQLRVNVSYLQDRVGDFAANREFDIEGDEVVLAGEDTEFVPFQPTEAAQFTLGSKKSLEFAERPMWVSISGDASELVLDMEDGDTSGQDLYISKEWLRNQGMHRPIATHEDGYGLTVRDSDDHQGFIVEMPHFTQVILTPADIDVKGRQGGSPFVHSGLITWDDVSMKLRIGVDLQLSDYDLLVEKDWFDLNMPYPALFDYEWVLENVSDKLYFTVSIPAAETPETVVFQEFGQSIGEVFSTGTPSTVQFDLPVIMDLVAATGDVNVTLSGQSISNGLKGTANVTWLSDNDLWTPGVRTSFGAATEQTIAGLEWLEFYVPPNATYVSITNLTGDGLFSLDFLEVNVLIQEPGDQCRALWQEEVEGDPIAIRQVATGGDSGFAWGLYAYKAAFCYEWTFSYHAEAELYHVWLWLADDAWGQGTTCGFTPVDSAAEFGAQSCQWPDPEEFPVNDIYWWIDASVSWFVSEGVVKSGTDCAGGVAIFAGGALARSPTLMIYGVLVAANECSGLKDELLYDGVKKGEHIYGGWGTSDSILGILEVVLVDPQDLRGDTWTFIEHLVQRDPSWDGYQTIYWTLDGVVHGRIDYTTDASSVGPSTFDGNQMTCDVGEGGGHCISNVDSFSGSAYGKAHTLGVVTRSGGTDRLDWEVPETPCLALGKIITAAYGDDELVLGTTDPVETCNGLWSLDVVDINGNIDMDAPWWEFVVNSTTIPGSAFSSMAGSVSINDVVAQDGNISRAIMLELISDVNYTDGITHIQFEYSGAPPLIQDCDAHETEYVTSFSVAGSGTSIIGGGSLSPADVEPLSICFDPLVGILVNWVEV